VAANNGAPGVDAQSIKMYEARLADNLYKLWNRMCSGSYHPKPVKRVWIPKYGGGKRPLGIPTIEDRVAQMAVKLWLEPQLDSLFHHDSYGYRPGKSALEAVAQCRKRCWRYNWVIDLDIKGFFDAIDHSLLMRAVEWHTKEKWVLLYICRWLSAEVDLGDGVRQRMDRGTPQGGVMTPRTQKITWHFRFFRQAFWAIGSRNRDRMFYL